MLADLGHSLNSMSNVVEISSEYYEFDLNDLISSVGGNLGLFLGWSLLSISEALMVIFPEFFLAAKTQLLTSTSLHTVP